MYETTKPNNINSIFLIGFVGIELEYVHITNKNDMVIGK